MYYSFLCFGLLLEATYIAYEGGILDQIIGPIELLLPFNIFALLLNVRMVSFFLQGKPNDIFLS